jgi:hypothetical protein
MGHSIFFKLPMIWLFFFLFCSCTDVNSIEDKSMPANLVVNVSISDEDEKTILVTATADFANKYELRIGSEMEPVEANSEGRFEYTFLKAGEYELDIRAYGSSGRFLRDLRYVEIKAREPVSIDKGYITPLEYEGYKLVWHDEFEGNNLNTDDWVFESGDGCPSLCGWGNNELQFYRSQNAWVSDGVLTIEAREESIQNRKYTSARIKTQGKQSFQYGRIDMRALLPKGQGIWPALWMLGDNINSVGWPACGEIDMMEMIGGGPGRDNRVHGTLHWDFNGHVEAGGRYTLASGTFADEYHVFTTIWDETSIKWYVNEIKFHEIDITPHHMTEFHQKFYFIFNVAVGGNWPGSPNENTVFPQQMKVDYIRVFQPE